MKKTLISLTERQRQKIQEEAESIGISKAELIRRILDSHIDKKEDQKNDTNGQTI